MTLDVFGRLWTSLDDFGQPPLEPLGTPWMTLGRPRNALECLGKSWNALNALECQGIPMNAVECHGMRRYAEEFRGMPRTAEETPGNALDLL